MILTETITPGFYETDALGHINNTVIPMWFEKGRVPLFKIFTPDLDPNKWCLIVVRLDVQFLAQTGYIDPVTIKTHIKRIGNSSFVVTQSCIQNEIETAKADTTMVHFDYQNQKSTPIPDAARQALHQYLTPDANAPLAGA